MSLSEIRNVVLLFSNPVWTGANTVPTTIIRNITALSSQIGWERTINGNLTTLTNKNAETLNGIIQGLLYVPDILPSNPCRELEKEYIPENVTRQANLPPTNYKLIALAPWFNGTCTQAYLAAARLDPIRAFIFYRPNNSGNKPQEADAPVWDLNDDGRWKVENHYPIFAMPSTEGNEMMTQLGQYSGDLTTIPHGDEITSLYGPNPRDYVRIWTELNVTDPNNLPAMWSYFLIVIGALIFIIICVSIMMHWVQRRRRISLRRRVESGEVDLEAMGIKKMTIPLKVVEGFETFIYYDHSQDNMSATAAAASASTSTAATAAPQDTTAQSSASSPPGTPKSSRHPRSSRNSRRGGGGAMARTNSEVAPSVRSRRSLVSRAPSSTKATNIQPRCHICLESFDSEKTLIRQLACFHIFHPECIDEFLTQNSSLCPICKQCMLPRGFCPKITNGMVRRERAMRQLRSKVHMEERRDKTEYESSSSANTSRLSPAIAAGDVPMTPIKSTRQPTSTTHVANQAATPTTLPNDEPKPAADAPPTTEPQTPRTRPRRDRTSQQLQLVPEDHSMVTQAAPARRSPTALARRRMQDLAEHFEDPDRQEPRWKRAITSLFPGFT